MFKRKNHNSLKVLFAFILLLTTVNNCFFAQEKESDNSKEWYICKIKSKQQVNTKKFYGPYDSLDTALANWIYLGIEEKNKYCIARNFSYMTNNPSSYFSKDYENVISDLEYDRNYFIEKYQIVTDKKIEAAYQKQKAAQEKKEAKESKKNKKQTSEKANDTNKNNLKTKENVSLTPVTEPDYAKDNEKAKENAAVVENKAKENAAKAEQTAIEKQKQAEEAINNKNIEAKLTKDDISTLINQKLEEANAELQNKSTEQENISKENLKNVSQVITESTELAKRSMEEAELESQNSPDESALPAAVEEYYKREKRNQLAKEIIEDANKEASEIKKDKQPENPENNVPQIVIQNKTFETEDKSVVLDYRQDDAEYVSLEPAEQEKTAEAAPVIPEAEAENIDQNVAEAPVPADNEQNKTVPFTFTSQQTNVTRYKKEYLQDFIPQDKYVPQEESQYVQKIENPDAKDSLGQTRLMKAAKSGNDWQIKTLLESGADVNLKDNDGWTALMYACRYQESLATIQTLIKAGAIVKEKNKFDSSALTLAANYNDNPEILKYLLTYYSNSEKEVLKCFILLLSSKQPSEYIQLAKINLFLDKSIPLNTFYQGKTPLMYAAQYGNSTKTLKLLIDNDALTTIRSTEGKTAFDYATKNSDLVHDENYWALNKK